MSGAPGSSGAEIRLIRPADDPAARRVLVEVLNEFGAVGEGFSGEDAELDSMSQAYAGPRAAYFVAELDGRIVGGSGVGPLAGAGAEVCELRKMYLLEVARGHGIGRRMLEICLEAACEMGYRVCYLETLAHMDRAQNLYERSGFRRLQAPMGDTGHFGCNRWYALQL